MAGFDVNRSTLAPAYTARESKHKEKFKENTLRKFDIIRIMRIKQSLLFEFVEVGSWKFYKVLCL